MAKMNLAKAVAAYERGLNAADAGDFMRAIAEFEGALRIQPNHMEAKVALANIYIRLYDFDRAILLLEEAARQFPDDAIVLGTLGAAYMAQGDEERSIDQFERAIKVSAEMPVELMLMLGDMILGSEQYDRVVNALSLIVERFPNNPYARVLLGRALFKMEDYDKASKQAEKALSLDEHSADAYNLQGVIAMAKGEFDTALQLFSREREYSDDGGRAMTMMAIVSIQIGKPEDAIALVEEVLERDDLDFETLFTCAQIYYNAGRYDDAIDLLKDILEEDPEDDDAIDLLLDIAVNTKNLEALDWLRDEFGGDEELLQVIDECEHTIEPKAPAKAKKPSGKAKTAPIITSDSAYQLRIELAGWRPPIWRSVLVAGNTTLAELHRIIQAVMDWDDYHMHEFTVRGARYSDPRAKVEGARNEQKATLAQIAPKVKDRIDYVYDFGDNWEVLITVTNIQPLDPAKEYPVCLTGKYAAPMEDIGGLGGYANILEMLTDPDHPDREDYAELIEGLEEEGFDPDVFDIDSANERLKEIRRR